MFKGGGDEVKSVSKPIGKVNVFYMNILYKNIQNEKCQMLIIKYAKNKKDLWDFWDLLEATVLLRINTGGGGINFFDF